MSERGFEHHPDNPVHVVRTPRGLTTIDNTRVAVAQELGLEAIVVVVHEWDDPLPELMVKAKRFGEAATWGEALEYRTSNQRPPLERYGTPQRPSLPAE